jgi:hypothetical protein
MQRLALSDLQKQALWLIGVLMGVALKEAMTNTHAVFVNRGEPWGWLMALVRLLLFWLVSLRFYLGAVYYFNTSFDEPPSVSGVLRRQFGRDLTFGLIHFAFVCFWGLSIALFDRGWSVFPLLLLTILLCDAFWYAWAVSATRRTIRIRTVVNVVTAGGATLAFGTSAFGYMCIANGWRVELTQSQVAVCEAVAYVPVAIATGVELGRLVHGRAGVEEWLGETLPPPEHHPG